MYKQNLKFIFTDDQIEALANYIITHKISLRTLAGIVNIPKSTLHLYFHQRLPNINFKKYEQLQAVLDKNFAQKHIRGGEATKKKFNNLKNEK